MCWPLCMVFLSPTATYLCPTRYKFKYIWRFIKTLCCAVVFVVIWYQIYYTLHSHFIRLLWYSNPLASMLLFFFFFGRQQKRTPTYAEMKWHSEETKRKHYALYIRIFKWPTSSRCIETIYIACSTTKRGVDKHFCIRVCCLARVRLVSLEDHFLRANEISCVVGVACAVAACKCVHKFLVALSVLGVLVLVVVCLLLMLNRDRELVMLR